MKLVQLGLAAAVLAGAMGLGACQNTGTGSQQTPKVLAGQNLYQRLGGEAGVDQLVGAWVENVMADKALSERFKGTDAAHLQKRLVAQVGEMTGGPQVYTGKDMRSAHKGMNISEGEWTAFMMDLKSRAAATKVGELEQAEMLVQLEPMKRDVVGQ